MPQRFQYPSKMEPVSQDAERTTPDKWLGNAPSILLRPVITAALIATSLFSIDPVQLTRVERTTPDKYIGYQQPYVERAKGFLAYLYPSIPQTDGLPRVASVDGWRGYQPDRIDKARGFPTHLNPQPQTDSKQLTLVERTTPDKYVGYQPDRVDRVRGFASHLYPSVPMDDDLPRVAGVDNWIGYQPERIERVRGLQTSSQIAFLTDSQSLTQAERTTPDKYVGYAPERIERVRGFNSHLYPAQSSIDTKQLTQAEATSPDRWLGSRPDVLFRLKPPCIVSGIQVGDILPYVASPDSWRGSYPDQLLPKTPLVRVGWFTTDAASLTQSEQTSVDRWVGYSPERVDRLRRAVDVGLTSFDPNPIVAVDTSVDRWIGTYPVRLDPKAAPVQVGWFSIDGKQLATPVITLDRWLGLQPERVERVRRPVDVGWFDIDAAQLTLRERITPDKWLGHQTDRVLLPVPSPVRIGIWTTDPTSLTRPESVSPDRWMGYEPSRIDKVKRPLDSGWFAIGNGDHETITLDKWWMPAPVYIWAKWKLLQTGWQIIDFRVEADQAPFIATRSGTADADTRAMSVWGDSESGGKA